MLSVLECGKERTKLSVAVGLTSRFVKRGDCDRLKDSITAHKRHIPGIRIVRNKVSIFRKHQMEFLHLEGILKPSLFYQ